MSLAATTAVAAGVEQQAGGVPGGLHVVLALRAAAADRQPVALQGAFPARGPLVSGAGAARPAEEGDPHVAQADEMVDRGVGAGGVVDVDPVADLPPRPHPPEGGERHAAPGEPRLPGVAVRGAAEYEAVDVVGVQQFLVRLQQPGPGGGGEQQDAMVSLVRGLGERVQKVIEHRGGGTGRHGLDAVAEEFAGAGAQGLRGAVGAVAEGVDGLTYALQGVGA